MRTKIPEENIKIPHENDATGKAALTDTVHLQGSVNVSAVCILWSQNTKPGDHPHWRVLHYDLHKTGAHSTSSLKEETHINSPLLP